MHGGHEGTQTKRELGVTWQADRAKVEGRAVGRTQGVTAGETAAGPMDGGGKGGRGGMVLERVRAVVVAVIVWAGVEGLGGENGASCWRRVALEKQTHDRDNKEGLRRDVAW